MDVSAAVALIRGAVSQRPETWAGLGAGSGTFTFALASLLGSGAHVFAIDRDHEALEQLRATALDTTLGARVTVMHGDFRDALDLPPLDGLLLANALHFVPTKEQAPFLKRVMAYLRPGGRLLIVDYDRRAANPWVPHPISSKRLAELLSELGLPPVTAVGTRPSMYGGTLYAVYTSATRAAATNR